MKKIALCSMMALFLSLSFYPLQSNAAKNVTPTTLVVPKTVETTEAKALLFRLNEINAMDKSSLNSAEKKNLRKEVRTIRHSLREIGGGVYLSVGAVILIVILLVVLL